MKVLLPASEVAPIVKLGGLGDVIGSLPKALSKLGVNIDVIVPFYSGAKVSENALFKSLEIEVPFDDKVNTVEVFRTKLPESNVDVFLLRNHEYLSAGGQHAFLNNKSETEMFAFFDRAVVNFIKSQLNTYDLVHCNDWHTGMIPHLLEDEIGESRPATLFTIHNLAYQGVGGLDIVQELGIVPGEHPLIEWDISDGDINFMQQGITSSDFVSTVSPTYAKEILTEEFGGELKDMLLARKDRLVGILNGIDVSNFPRDYDVTNWKGAKLQHKKELSQMLGLSDSHRPLVSFIGRLDPNQKGLDILLESIESIVDLGFSFVLLGTGEKKVEEELKLLESRENLKGKVGIKVAFDIDLARKIYAGSDFLVVPSKYEPCGLIQMLAMWYGTLPVVHAVGGLKDSVIPGQNGFLFEEYSSKSLIFALEHAISTYLGHYEYSYEKMVEKAMTTDFSWDSSAKKYKKLFEKVVGLRNA